MTGGIAGCIVQGALHPRLALRQLRVDVLADRSRWGRDSSVADARDTGRHPTVTKWTRWAGRVPGDDCGEAAPTAHLC